jgi:hypothetical protein
MADERSRVFVSDSAKSSTQHRQMGKSDVVLYGQKFAMTWHHR